MERGLPAYSNDKRNSFACKIYKPHREGPRLVEAINKPVSKFHKFAANIERGERGRVGGRERARKGICWHCALIKLAP